MKMPPLSCVPGRGGGVQQSEILPSGLVHLLTQEVGHRHEADAADHVAQGHGDQVVEVANKRHRLAGGIEERHREPRHVGNRVLGAAGDEGKEAPEDHDELHGIVRGPEGAPHCQADEDIAEDATYEEQDEGGTHLAGSSRRERAGSPRR